MQNTVPYPGRQGASDVHTVPSCPSNGEVSLPAVTALATVFHSEVALPLWPPNTLYLPVNSALSPSAIAVLFITNMMRPPLPPPPPLSPPFPPLACTSPWNSSQSDCTKMLPPEPPPEFSAVATPPSASSTAR